MPAERRACLLPFPGWGSVFVHLHCHSHYSFLRGVASPEEIVAAAAEQELRAGALPDTNGLYAAVQFYKLAKEKKVKPIVGVALDVEFRISSDPSAALRTST